MRRSVSSQDARSLSVSCDLRPAIGCEWLCALQQLPLPEAATCLLPLDARHLLASFAGTQPHVLSCLGASWEVPQPPDPAETMRERSESQRMSSQNGTAQRPIDWGAGGLADFIVHETEGRREVRCTPLPHFSTGDESHSWRAGLNPPL